MAETSWEEHAKRRTWIWKWLLIILIGVLLAGIIIQNNRDVIYGIVGSRGERDSITAFSVTEEKRAPVTVEPRIVDKTASSGKYADSTVAAPSHRKIPPHGVTAVKVKAAGDLVVRREKPKQPVVAKAVPERQTISSLDSVEIGEVPCRILNRKDIVVRVVLVVYCDQLARQEVLIKRDALGVALQNTLRTRDLETVKLKALTPELLGAMNSMFDTKTITGVIFRTVRIEKASYE